MSLELAINNALTGLNVNQTALSTVSQNIANANTEGYTRKIVEQSAQYVGNQGVGTGVRIDDIVRKVDSYLQRSARAQTSLSSRTDEVDEYMDRIQVLLGQPGDVNTLDEYLTQFFNNLQSLADTPERISFRETAVDSGITLAREISDLALGLEDLRLQADSDIAESVNFMNDLLFDLEQINVAILNASVLGNPISGLQDEQDKIIGQISEIIDVDVLVQESNEVYLYAANGIALLDESSYELEYAQAFSIETLIQDASLNAVQVYRLNEDGQRINPPEELVSSGVESSITSPIEQGKMRALLDLRDSIIPDLTAQLDELASVLRDAFNVLHNNGSSFPGTNVLNGTRSVSAHDVYNWDGNVRIAVLDDNGQPVSSQFDHESATGMRALDLDLTFLDGGTGAGQPDIQTIMDEINNHFNPPTTKVSLGNINNIQLVSITDEIPNASTSFEFDFDLENISGLDADFYVTDVQILDDGGANITNVTSTRPSIPVTQYLTTVGSRTVTVNAGSHGLQEGEFIYIEQPGAAVGGIPPTDFGIFFQATNVTANTFDILVNTPAAAGGITLGAGEDIITDYDTIVAGEKRRVRDNGTITADLTGNPNSTYYDIQVEVGIFDEQAGAVSDLRNATITYRVFNNSINLMNDRFDHTAVTGPFAERHVPSDNTPFMRAILVDENGDELRKVEGDYFDQQGFLRLVTEQENYTIAIDELDSQQLGVTTTTPRTEGTNRGFSHFFELNNFFVSNNPTATGDTTAGSAINMAVEQRLQDNANLITLGNLELSNQPADPNADPLYTYERFAGANGAIQRLSEINDTLLQFDAAGGLDSSEQSINGYLGEVLAFYGSKAATAELAAKDNQILLEGFTQRIDSFQGVNVDEELANTIIYQNAYNASARIISVTGEMFDTLFDAVS